MIPLRLLPDASITPATTTADAWLVPGADAGHWLAWLAAHAGAATGMRLAVLPRGARDPRPAGLLVLAALTPADAGGALPFRRVGRALHLPLAARLWPPVTAVEADALFTGDVVVWHPGVGPVAFATAELLGVADLVAPPTVRAGRWDRAQRGELQARLLAITVPPLPDVQTLLAGGGGDIGTQAPDALAPDGKEPGLVERGVGRARQAVAKVTGGLTGLVGRMAGAFGGSGGNSGSPAPAGAAGSGGGSWLSHLQAWASRVLAEQDPRLHDARHRELERLLRDLADDPDHGLRFALPLSGEGAHRGVASPGTSLSERQVDYRWGGGSAAADGWAVDPRMQMALRTRYLELAKREIALGRHRRAAYIFAILLGDQQSAVAALEQGRHFREAAAILREKLGQPLAAAQCLERGGLLDEAAALFEAHDAPQQAAGCHQRLGRLDDARRCWRLAVARLVRNHDEVAAAALLAEQLEAPDEALALLAGTWPRHAMAGRCLIARVDLLGRLGRHGATGDLIRELAGQTDAHHLLVLDAFAHAVGRYPDDAIRQHAADAGRVLVGQQLAGGGPADHLLRRLHELAPGDRLLAGDAERWKRLPVAPRAQPAATSPAALTNLGSEALWMTATSCPLGVVAVGWAGERLQVAAATWAGKIGSLILPEVPDGQPRMFMIAGGTAGRAYLRVGSGRQWAPVPISMKAADDAWGAQLAVGTFGPLFGTVAGIAPAHDGGWWMLIEGDTGGWKAVRASPSGPLEQVPLPDPPGDRPIVLGRLGQHVAMGVGSFIAVAGSGLALCGTDTGNDIRELVAHPDAAEPCVIALTALGAIACWLRGDRLALTRFGEDFGEQAQAGFTSDGILVLAGAAGRRAYRCHDGAVRLLSSAPGAMTGAIAVVAGPGAGSAMLVSRDGLVEEWRVADTGT